MDSLEKIIEENQGLIYKVIKDLRINDRILYNNKEDLMQDGNIALVEAYNSFNEEDSKIKFSTYSYNIIKFRILDKLRTEYNSSMIPFKLPKETTMVLKMNDKGLSNSEIAEKLSGKNKKVNEKFVKTILLRYKTVFIDLDDEDNDVEVKQNNNNFNDVIAFEFIDEMFKNKIISKKHYKIMKAHMQGYDNEQIALLVNMKKNHVPTEIKRAGEKMRKYIKI